MDCATFETSEVVRDVEPESAVVGVAASVVTATVVLARCSSDTGLMDDVMAMVGV